MRRQMRVVALAVSFVLALGTFAVAQGYDDYGRGAAAQARQYGYDNGFRDGQHRGQHEGRENDPYDYHTPDWHQASHGYKNWMGPISAFQNGAPFSSANRITSLDCAFAAEYFAQRRLVNEVCNCAYIKVPAWRPSRASTSA